MRVCERCGVRIDGRHGKARFCSRDCQVAAYRQGPSYRSTAHRHSATGIRFDPDIHDRLLTESGARGLSVNWIVNRLVREGLDRLTDTTRLTQ